jgi:predicted MPP superfamily phosphohydrolase
LKAWPVLGIAIIQSILLLAQWFLLSTWIDFHGDPGPSALLTLRVVLLALAVSFVAASLLSFFSASSAVKVLYRIAAVWMGFLNFFFWSACLCWLAWGALVLTRIDPHAALHRPLLAWFFLDLAVAVGLYGLVNARRVRIRRVPVTLANLPEAWRGRTAMLVSDLHLGHVRGLAFSRRIVALAASLRPDILLIAGDVFDGTKVDAARVVAPFKELSPRFGVYFATGNHDEFGDTRGFLAALAGAGIRILANEKAIVDGLQIVGVPYHDSTLPMRLRASLQGLGIDRSMASILISHVPNRLPIAEEAGIGLQLSGHTHGGQFIPFTWLTRRVFGKFTYGLHSFGALQVYTSYGAGTWGPPMRVGTSPEIVLLEFK